MQKIKDVSIEEIKQGQNWKVYVPEDPNLPLEEWEIEVAEVFLPEDNIAYSAIFVEDGAEKVKPLIQIKEVGYLDYGGDYCEWVDGKWQQLGLTPNPNASSGKDYVANPLTNDPSFDADWDYRKDHSDNFKKWVVKLV
jgi:hypothetical protein